jgi:hypothetical protein
MQKVGHDYYSFVNILWTKLILRAFQSNATFSIMILIITTLIIIIFSAKTLSIKKLEPTERCFHFTLTDFLGAGSGLFFCKNLKASSFTDGSFAGRSVIFSFFFGFASAPASVVDEEFWREKICGTTSGGGLNGEPLISRFDLELIKYCLRSILENVFII